MFYENKYSSEQITSVSYAGTLALYQSSDHILRLAFDNSGREESPQRNNLVGGDSGRHEQHQSSLQPSNDGNQRSEPPTCPPPPVPSSTSTTQEPKYQNLPMFKELPAMPRRAKTPPVGVVRPDFRISPEYDQCYANKRLSIPASTDIIMNKRRIEKDLDYKVPPPPKLVEGLRAKSLADLNTFSLYENTKELEASAQEGSKRVLRQQSDPLEYFNVPRGWKVFKGSWGNIDEPLTTLERKGYKHDSPPNVTCLCPPSPKM